jgi:hypothetical protein
MLFIPHADQLAINHITAVKCPNYVLAQLSNYIMVCSSCKEEQWQLSTILLLQYIFSFGLFFHPQR